MHIKIGRFEIGKPDPAKEINTVSEEPQPEAYGAVDLTYNRVFPVLYNGETDAGEVGPIIMYMKDPYALRLRSEQLYIESPICKAVIDKYVKWVIGTNGLRLKCEPQTTVLKKFGINIDSEAFNTDNESMWKTLANSKLFDYAGEQTLKKMQEETVRKSLLGGDMLIVLRVINGIVKRQHIDGYNVINPVGCSFNGVDYIAENGNRIRMGVEIDATGKHVAYHVRCNIMETIRIEAYGSKSGRRMAYLYVETKDTDVNATRGVSLIMSIMQTAKKLGRYIDASLARAEDVAKMSLLIQHEINGTGEDPFIQQRATASLGRPLASTPNDDLAFDVNGIALQNRVAASTKHTTVNLPRGAKVATVDSSHEAKVAEFVCINADIMCAAINMPPDVMWGKYNGSFSSSRMSGKAWESTFISVRNNFGQMDMDIMYELQMYVWVNMNMIQAPGFILAIQKKNDLVIQAYLFSSWVGDKYPDIDELKTANYVRRAMGSAGEHLPLMTGEEAAQILGQGDYSGILNQYSAELAAAEKLQIARQDARTANDGSVEENAEDESDTEK